MSKYRTDVNAHIENQFYKMKATSIRSICDHCNKRVEELWVDSDGWHICPGHWKLYHLNEPKVWRY